MKRTFIPLSLAMACLCFTAYAADLSGNPQKPVDAPIIELGADDRLISTLETMLQNKTGKLVSIKDGNWLVIYGSQPIPKEKIGSIDLSTVGSIDVLSRRNGKYDGTIVISIMGS